MHLTPVDSRALGIGIVDNKFDAFYVGCGAKLFGYFFNNDSERRNVGVEPYRAAVFQ